MVNVIQGISEDQIELVDAFLQIRGADIAGDLLRSLNGWQIAARFAIGDVGHQLPMLGADLDAYPRLRNPLGGADVQHNLDRLAHSEDIGGRIAPVTKFHADKVR